MCAEVLNKDIQAELLIAPCQYHSVALLNPEWIGHIDLLLCVELGLARV